MLEATWTVAGVAVPGRAWVRVIGVRRVKEGASLTASTTMVRRCVFEAFLPAVCPACPAPPSSRSVTSHSVTPLALAAVSTVSSPVWGSSSGAVARMPLSPDTRVSAKVSCWCDSSLVPAAEAEMLVATISVAGSSSSRMTSVVRRLNTGARLYELELLEDEEDELDEELDEAEDDELDDELLALLLEELEEDEDEEDELEEEEEEEEEELDDDLDEEEEELWEDELLALPS
mmetsp:Transcript_59620/g.146435  ORF Transcript_59620/g.146435 Transcript_59620/m.146435 type:complete len:232 (-) Transcript_59620:253-948(-)